MDGTFRLILPATVTDLPPAFRRLSYRTFQTHGSFYPPGRPGVNERRGLEQLPSWPITAPRGRAPWWRLPRSRSPRPSARTVRPPGGWHCWLVQQCCSSDLEALLGKPAVAPNAVNPFLQGITYFPRFSHSTNVWQNARPHIGNTDLTENTISQRVAKRVNGVEWHPHVQSGRRRACPGGAMIDHYHGHSSLNIQYSIFLIHRPLPHPATAGLAPVEP